MACQYVASATLVEGVLQGTNESFQSLFIDDSGLLEYLLPKIYTGPHRIVLKRKVMIPLLSSTLKRAAESSVDLCIAVLPLRYEARFKTLCDFQGPGQVRFMLNVSGIECENDLGTPSSERWRETEKLINKYGLAYRVSRDLQDLHRFYYQMHVPLISKRHGDLAYVESFEVMKEYFSKGFLLFVTQEGHDIGGSLSWVNEDTLINRRAGVLNGDEAYIRQGVQAAWRLFSIMEARRNKLKRIDLMASHAFMKDGIYRNKRDWGAAVQIDDEQEVSMYFFNMGSPEKMARFYERNPVIVNADKGLMGVVGIGEDATAGGEGRRALIKQFYTPGLEGLIIMMPHSKKPIAIHFDAKDCTKLVP